jgi:hypothetical protein
VTWATERGDSFHEEPAFRWEGFWTGLVASFIPIGGWLIAIAWFYFFTDREKRWARIRGVLLGVVAAVILGALYLQYVNSGQGTVAAPVESIYQPRLTAPEAAALAQTHILNSVSSSVRSGLRLNCTGQAFNNSSRQWIVVCIASGGSAALSLTYRVDDMTRVVSPVQ